MGNGYIQWICLSRVSHSQLVSGRELVKFDSSIVPSPGMNIFFFANTTRRPSLCRGHNFDFRRTPEIVLDSKSIQEPYESIPNSAHPSTGPWRVHRQPVTSSVAIANNFG